MIAFAEFNFALNKQDKNGKTQREHLQQVEKATGKKPKELDGPPIPLNGMFVWDSFLDIHQGRSYGMSGPNPLSWEAISAWCNLNEIVLSSWEIGMIKSLDSIWVRIAHED